MEVLSGRVLLRPLDLDRSAAFYGDALGLAIYREYGEGEHRGIVYFMGGGFLELSGRAHTEPGRNVELWLQVRDLVETHAALVGAGVTVLDPPARQPWGLDEMWIEDPDGVRIVVVEVPAEHPLRYRP